MAASTYPSTQWASVRRGELPCFAASDIVAGTLVRVASSGDWAVQMVASTTEEPLGFARDDAAAGQAVAVYDDGNVFRAIAGASFSRQSQVGVVGASTMNHRISGVSVSYPVVGQVLGTPSIAVGASAPAVWSAGQALESAALNDQVAVRVKPRLLSGLS